MHPARGAPLPVRQLHSVCVSVYQSALSFLFRVLAVYSRAHTRLHTHTTHIYCCVRGSAGMTGRTNPGRVIAPPCQAPDCHSSGGYPEGCCFFTRTHICTENGNDSGLDMWAAVCAGVAGTRLQVASLASLWTSSCVDLSND